MRSWSTGVGPKTRCWSEPRDVYRFKDVYRYCNAVQKHRGEPGHTRYQHCSYRGERYTAHARARLARRSCADAAGSPRMARVRGICEASCAVVVLVPGHTVLGGEPNGKTEGEAKADFMRWSSGAPCNLVTCDVHWASERRQARRARGRVVGGQLLSRNAAQTINVLGFCRSAICRSS
jgi:hypothetical protein